MSGDWTWGLVPALVLFWSVGAYNRLMRLSADMAVALAALDARWQQQIGLARASVPPHAGIDHGIAGEPWAQLRAAIDGLSSSLAAVRARRADAQCMAAAAQARDLLMAAWLQVQQGSRDLAGDLLPESVVQQWHLGLRECEQLNQQFNSAVQQYNEAIAQFPAVLLAKAFGFQPGQAL